MFRATSGIRYTCGIYHMSYWYNWFALWWANGCSKHVEYWKKINIYGKVLCVRLVIYKNYTEMHGQQNIKYYRTLHFSYIPCIYVLRTTSTVNYIYIFFPYNINPSVLLIQAQSNLCKVRNESLYTSELVLQIQFPYVSHLLDNSLSSETCLCIM